MILRIFNPSHDECLASGSPYYTPSRTARQMDEVHLPGWHCLSDDLSSWQDVERIEPWGWDARITHQLRRRGCPERLLPSAERLDTIRRLSSRQTAVRLLPMVTDKFKSWYLPLPPPPKGGEPRHTLKTLEELSPFGGVGGGRGSLLFKSPWSCSGRGVFTYDEQRIQKVMREQGGIEVEPFYPRVADFAMEFRCQGGEVEFLGLSAMLNGGASTHVAGYGGNIVASDTTIRKLMTRYVPEKEVNEARDKLLNVLRREIAPHYDGPLGIDQMIVSLTPDDNAPSAYALHPLVEINLRHTMGLVAIEMRDALL